MTGGGLDTDYGHEENVKLFNTKKEAEQYIKQHLNKQWSIEKAEYE